MSAIAGLRGTGQFNTDFRPTNYRELFTLLEPNGSAPLNALLSMASSDSTDDPKYTHFRDELPSRVLKVGAGGATNVATTIPLVADTNIAFIVPNTLMYNTRTGEVFRATVAGDTVGNQVVSVVRGVGTTAAAAMSANDVLVISGYADIEGAGKPSAATFDPTTDYNFTQIFKTGVSITNTMKETYLRTGSKEQEMVTKALKLHMGDIERAMFFGQRNIENASTAQPRRYTGGLFSMIPNVTDAASGFTTANTITEKEFDRLLIETIFAWGGKEKIMFAGPRVVSNLMAIAKSKWTPEAVDNAYGVKFTRYSTFAGDLLVYLHPLFRQIPGFDSTAAILDMQHVKYRYMANRDTSLRREVQSPDADATEHYYLTECGLELTQGKPHQIIKNWQA